MKVVVLAGGFGTRISEESYLKPKPMIEIGGRPILWHIMKIYSAYGFSEFLICLGYKGYVIKNYFCNYVLNTSDITVDMKTDAIEFHRREAESWKVTLVDTGENTNTGGRLKRLKEYLPPNETFCLTYGDGLSNVNLSQEVDFHKRHKKLATVCAVQPTGRYGALIRMGEKIQGFQEKPAGDGVWANGGFFVLQPEVLDYIDGDETAWEAEPLERLASVGELHAFEHKEFWQCMDTVREKKILEELWESGNPPWKIW